MKLTVLPHVAVLYNCYNLQDKLKAEQEASVRAPQNCLTSAAANWTAVAFDTGCAAEGQAASATATASVLTRVVIAKLSDDICCA